MPLRARAVVHALVLALAGLAVAFSARAQEGAAAPAHVTISVLHTTDLHGHLLAWDYATGKPVDGYGLAKVATLIRRVRAEQGARTVLVDAGDCIEGSPLSDRHDAQVA